MNILFLVLQWVRYFTSALPGWACLGGFALTWCRVIWLLLLPGRSVSGPCSIRSQSSWAVGRLRFRGDFRVWLGAGLGCACFRFLSSLPLGGRRWPSGGRALLWLLRRWLVSRFASRIHPWLQFRQLHSDCGSGLSVKPSVLDWNLRQSEVDFAQPDTDFESHSFF